MRNLKVIQVYLMIVPLWVLIVAFAFGHLGPSVYVPVWIIHSIVMALAGWTLARPFLKGNTDEQTKYIAYFSMLVITAWIFISVFFGFGPPPVTLELWIERGIEQEIRYAILIFAGALSIIAFSLLRGALKRASENFYSRMGMTILAVAVPLYILNMAFWGSFLTAAFKTFISTGKTIRPDWYGPLRALFGEISTVEVALIYFATAAFTLALKKTGWIKPATANLYLVISMTAMVLDFMPAGNFVPLQIAGHFVSIPAIPFVIPYLLAIHLLINLHSPLRKISGY